MSSMLFPLRSTFLRQVLLPRALTRTVPRDRSLDSVRDRDCRAWREDGVFERSRDWEDVKQWNLLRRYVTARQYDSTCCVCELFTI